LATLCIKGLSNADNAHKRWTDADVGRAAPHASPRQRTAVNVSVKIYYYDCQSTLNAKPNR